MTEGEILQKYAFAKDVLAVAILGGVGDWSAYIGAVQGINHDVEQFEVAKFGEKLPEDIARLIFPQVAKEYIWRN